MSQTEKATSVAQNPKELTVNTVLETFLTSHSLLDVLDTLRDAHTALHFKGLDEASEAVDKKDFLSIQEQNYDANNMMNSVVTFVANIIHLKTKHQ